MSPILMFFDLETTGLQDPHIIQIAAQAKDREFNIFLYPGKPIEREAALIHKMSVFEGRVYKDNALMPTVSPSVACSQFLDFCKSFNCSVVLAAHNAFKYDAKLIINLMKATGHFGLFSQVCTGVADTLPLLRMKLSNQKSHKLETLVNQFFPEMLPLLHDALADVHALKKVCHRVGLSDSDLITASKNINDRFY